jgi:quinolinate synthase
VLYRVSPASNHFMTEKTDIYKSDRGVIIRDSQNLTSLAKRIQGYRMRS